MSWINEPEPKLRSTLKPVSAIATWEGLCFKPPKNRRTQTVTWTSRVQLDHRWGSSYLPMQSTWSTGCPASAAIFSVIAASIGIGINQNLPEHSRYFRMHLMPLPPRMGKPNLRDGNALEDIRRERKSRPGARVQPEWNLRPRKADIAVPNNPSGDLRAGASSAECDRETRKQNQESIPDQARLGPRNRSSGVHRSTHAAARSTLTGAIFACTVYLFWTLATVVEDAFETIRLESSTSSSRSSSRTSQRSRLCGAATNDVCDDNVYSAIGSGISM